MMLPIFYLVFIIIYINIIDALEEYQCDQDLNMNLMIMKSKWTNYYFWYSTDLSCCLCFYSRIDSLSDYLSIYYESLKIEVDIGYKSREIKKIVINLYDHYSTNYSSQ